MTENSEVERLEKVYREYQERNLADTQWSDANPGNQAVARARDRLLRRMLETRGYFPLAAQRILEVGCGSGKVLGAFLDWGAKPDHLCGVDLLPERIEVAKRNHPGVRFQVGNAETLPFDAGAFDLVLLFTVFTSILDDAMAARVAGEVCRVLRGGGAAVWYDFRFDNPRNRNVRGLGRRDIQRLFPACRPELRTVTLVPPLARRLGGWTPLLYPLLAAVPLLRTHYLGLLIKCTTRP